MLYNSTTKGLGFTLLELMIVIGVVGILAAIAIPIYNNYSKKAYYSELIKATAPFKHGVEECYQFTQNLSTCASGQNSVPASITSSTGTIIGSISVSNGVITAIPQNQKGIVSTDTYVLTPTASNQGVIIWAASGGGITQGYTK